MTGARIGFLRCGRRRRYMPDHGIRRALDMKPLADLAVESVGGVPVAAVSGEIDISNASELSARISELAAEAGGGLAVDLTAVDYLDSSGLRVLLNLASACADRGQELRVVVENGSFIASLMETTGVVGILSVSGSRDQAVRELASAR
jgi:anti-sigma B factor antagonist